MSSTKKTTVHPVKFGAPVDSIPEANLPRGHNGAPHWNAIAAHVEASPGAWIPCTIPHLSLNAQRAGAAAINSASAHGKGILAFRKPGFRAAFRENTLYVRYDTPAVAKLRRAQ